MRTTSTATASTVATQTSRGSGGLFIKNIYHITQRSTLTKRKRNLLDFPSHIRDKNVGFPVGRSRYPQETDSCQVWVTCGRVRFGSKRIKAIEFRCPLWVISGHLQCKKACPLSANNGHDDESARFPWIGGACKPDFGCP